MKKILAQLVICALLICSVFSIPKTYATGITVDTSNVMATQFSATASSYTKSFTVGTGSNTVLIVVAGYGSGIPSLSSVTYAGTSMTKINKVSFQEPTSVEIWYLVAPSTGTNNIVATASSGTAKFTLAALSIFGASQTGIPDSQHVDGSQTGSVTSYSQSTTVVAANSFLIMGGRANGGAALTGGTNTTPTTPEVGAFGNFMAYSTATVGTGSQTLAVTSSSQQFYAAMASFAPVAATTSNPVTRISLPTGRESIIKGRFNITGN